MRLALAFVRQWQADAATAGESHEVRSAVAKFALRLERRETLGSMLALGKAIKPIADDGAGWDRDPWLLGVPNGVVDLRTGTLRDGVQADRITMATTVPYGDCDGSACR